MMILTRPSFFILVPCLVASLGGLSLATENPSAPPSPYRLYLKAQQLEWRNQNVEAWPFWQALSEQAILPFERRFELAERLTKVHGYTLTKTWLHRQASGSTRDLVLHHEYDFFHHPRSASWQTEWSDSVLQSLQKHPDSLELQTLLQAYSSEATALPVILPPSLHEDEAIAYFRGLQNRMSLGKLEDREANLAHLNAVLTELSTLAGLGKNPASKWYYFIIDFHIAVGDLKKAHQQLLEQLKTAPQDRGLLKRLYAWQLADHQMEAAKQTFSKLIRTGPLALEDYASHAKILHEARDYEGEIHCLLEGLRHHVASLPLFESVNRAYLALASKEEVRLQFALRTSKRFPREAAGYYFLGLSQYELGHFEQALHSLEHGAILAKSTTPKLLDLLFYHALGHSYAALHRPQDSIRSFELALKIPGDDRPELRGECAHTAARVTMQVSLQAATAEAFAKKALRWSPESIEYHLTLAEWQLANAQGKQSLLTLEQAKTYLPPNHPEASAWIVQSVKTHLQLQQHDEARRVMEESAQVYPLSNEVQQTLKSLLRPKSQ